MNHWRIVLAVTVLMLLICGCAPAQTYTSVGITWINNWNAAPWVVCAAPGDAVCVSGYTLTITPPSGTPVVAALTPSDSAYTWTPGGSLPAGLYKVALALDYDDSNGAGLAETPVTVSFTVAQGAPKGASGLGVVLK